ncbi:MoxR-like ATPase [Halogranum amylolyticum]|uniref:MoxR-like ATPase n=1 Tax=Halogranum amylolyticum TaxID=660520 RepID=A0A1H8WQ95_9EURY|nr:MoxR family ATPase [Halogranum amylolyticum]SEP29821.1 MoxR-like ATPase [Halogranum amylolyticum]
MSDPEAIFEAIREETGTVLIGNETIVEGLAISMLTGGHTLLEGVPGVAKTTIANLFARTIGLQYQRIQMTPDVLPADITGTHIYRENIGEFELQRGPIFANLVLADEINRATPKTQSALLEAMQEGRVTIEGDTLSLPKPFMVIATQNPIEQEGTFELPEAQRDRFQLKYIVDLPARAEERALLQRFDSDPDLSPESITQVVHIEDLLAARETVNEVYVDQKVLEYILDIVSATRESELLEHGASPRASLAFLNAGKARAAIHGREFVTPDDIKTLAPNVLIHRVILGTEAELSGRSRTEIVSEILDSVDIPTKDLQDDVVSSAETSN